MGLRIFIEAWRYLPEAIKLGREKAIANKELAERAFIAKTFNDRYTYRKKLIQGLELKGSIFNVGGYAWMCPECNKVHMPTEFSPFVGLIYPDCCKTRTGHRCYEDIRSS